LNKKSENASLTIQDSGLTKKDNEKIKPQTSKVVIKKADNKSGSNKDDLNEEKGLSFEKYVVSKINRNFFEILEWQGDKFHEGAYAKSNMNPDLVIRTKNNKATIALECKWRSKFYNEQVQWSTDDQLERYLQYQKSKGTKVYVIIGIGGEPITPSEVYLVPLDKLKYPFVTKSYLEQYKHHNVNKNFYLEIDQ
jgi:hypothetical protein